MKSELKFYLGAVALTLILIVGAAVALTGNNRGETAVLSAEDLVVDGANAKGPENAKVTVVEFSDFQCPACKAANNDLKPFFEKYKDRLRFVYRHFPLPQHEYAFKAAEASEAAGEQGRFWEYAAKLFENQPVDPAKSLTRDDFQKFAKDLGLETEKFNEALASDKYAAKVTKDVNDGARLGVSSTPTFYVNGRKVNNWGEMEKLISEDLAK